jgi:hypothetical protein
MHIYIYLYTYVFFNIIGYTYNLPEKKTSDPPRPQAPGVPPPVPLQRRSPRMPVPTAAALRPLRAAGVRPTTTGRMRSWTDLDGLPVFL